MLTRIFIKKFILISDKRPPINMRIDKTFKWF